MKIIAADIGGTKSWLCLCEIDPAVITNTQSNTPFTPFTSFTPLNAQQCELHYEHIYPSADFADFSALLTHFLHDAQAGGLSTVKDLSVVEGSFTADGFFTADGSIKIDAMCLALPGVIKQRHAHLTNLDWELSADDLQTRFNIAEVTFVNDFQAAAMGVTTLQEQDTVALNPVSVEDNAITVVTGAGTGLGLAWMDNTQDELQLFATEGGHCDFAPTNDQQIELLKFLQKQHGHVSYERILSGSGLEQLYDFLTLADEAIKNTTTPITAKEITKLAEQDNPQALSALHLFVDIYAAYIGNLALLYQPAGGIYIAGGIAKHILPWMQGKAFIDSYLHKGRMSKLAGQIPVYLITNNRLGLQGAIQLALKELAKNTPHPDRQTTRLKAV